MTLREYFKVKDLLKITLLNNVFVCISVEDELIIIELSRDKDYFEEIQLATSYIYDKITFDTKIEDIKNIIIDYVLNRYIIEHI